MSATVRVSIVCDICRSERPASFETIANRAGLTKGGGQVDARKEAIRDGWKRVRSGRYTLDVCPKCDGSPIPSIPWFAARSSNADD